ncbi:hypothetical protein LP420_24625 [Massilia sp. B-10]|nr:hypothetical protein LP420_24625 [Massilia sp. B-10]
MVMLVWVAPGWADAVATAVLIACAAALGLVAPAYQQRDQSHEVSLATDFGALGSCRGSQIGQQLQCVVAACHYVYTMSVALNEPPLRVRWRVTWSTIG